MLTIAVGAAVFAAELSLIALSFNLAYRVLRFANFAHVDFVTVGAYVAFSVSTVAPLWVAALCGTLSGGLTAVALNLSVFRPLQEASVATKMIASAGIAIAIRALIQLFWGVETRRFEEPTKVIEIGGALVTVTQLVIIGTAAVSVLVFWAVLKYTRLGRNLRATADSIALAEVRGVKSGLVMNQVWFISGALAGLSGVLIGLETFLRPSLGFSLLIPMFAAAIVGGFGSPFGAILGACLVSGAQSAVVSIDFGILGLGEGDYYLGSHYKVIVAFILLILILMVRPGGFFGEQKARA